MFVTMAAKINSVNVRLIACFRSDKTSEAYDRWKAVLSATE